MNGDCCVFYDMSRCQQRRSPFRSALLSPSGAMTRFANLLLSLEEAPAWHDECLSSYHLMCGPCQACAPRRRGVLRVATVQHGRCFSGQVSPASIKHHASQM
jgi:hypothetical protein